MAEKEQLVKSLNITRQIIHRKLGLFASSALGDDLYFLHETISMLRSDIGDDLLKKSYGKNYPVVVHRLEKIGERLSKIKIYYDSLKDKKFEEGEKELEIKKLFFEALSRIRLSEKLIYDVFMIYVKKSALRYQTISNDCFKLIEREYKVVDLKTKRIEEEKREEGDEK
jgi:hypothetical protein